MRTETGLAKCLNLFIFIFVTFFFHVVFFFFHWLLSGDKKAIPESGWVFNVVRKQPVYHQISPRHLEGPFPQKMIRIKPNFKQGFRV